MATLEDELKRHYWNVGRVAVSAANLEGRVALIVHGGTGEDAFRDNWLVDADQPGKAMKGLRRVCTEFAEVEGLAAFKDEVVELLQERHRLTHSVVQLAFPMNDQGIITVRSGDSLGFEQIHPKSGDRAPLRTDEDVERTVMRMDELTDQALKLATAVWIRANQRLAEHKTQTDAGT